jgi:hypothetical protein
MATQTQASRIVGFGWSLTVVGVLSSLLVILKEKNDSVMAWMKAASGHHWITQGAIVVVSFVVLGWLFSQWRTDDRPAFNKVAALIVVATALSGLMLAVFFLLD